MVLPQTSFPGPFSLSAIVHIVLCKAPSFSLLILWRWFPTLRIRITRGGVKTCSRGGPTCREVLVNWAYGGPRHWGFKSSSANASARPGLQTPGLCALAVSFPLMLFTQKSFTPVLLFVLAIAFSITPSECSTNPNCRTCAELISIISSHRSSL